MAQRYRADINDKVFPRDLHTMECHIYTIYLHCILLIPLSGNSTTVLINGGLILCTPKLNKVYLTLNKVYLTLYDDITEHMHEYMYRYCD